MWTGYPQLSALRLWRKSEERTPQRKLRCGSFFIRSGTGIGFTSRLFPAVPTLFFELEEESFSFMAASGMGIPAVVASAPPRTVNSGIEN